MSEPDFCLCKNKGADQLCSNCELDQRLCFRYTDSPIPLLLKGTHLRPIGERFITWDLPIEIVVGVA